MAKNDDLTALFKAFMESRTDTAEDKDELKLRIKDLDRTLKEITQFFKTQGLYSKELGVVLKQAIEVEKQEVKRKKGSGQGLPRMVSDMHLDSIIKRAIEGSLKGTAGIFDTKNQNKLLQDSIKTIKDNQNAYEKLSNSLTGLQKSVADLGGKLAALMGTSGGTKDPAGNGSGLGALAAALAGKGKNGKDPDLKSAVPKGNGFMKGIGTLIGFLGNKSGSGFLGKLGGMLAEYAKGVGWDVLKLAAYATMSLFRNFGGPNGILKGIAKLIIPGFSIFKGISSGILKGIVTGTKAGTKAGLKAGAKTGLAVAGKTALKAGTKGTLIGATLGSGINVASGIGKWKEGDKAGGMAEFASAALPWVGALVGFLLGGPVGAGIGLAIGSAASIMTDVGIGVRDYNRAKEKELEETKNGLHKISEQQKEAQTKQGGFFEWFKSICPWGDKGNDQPVTQNTSNSGGQDTKQGGKTSGKLGEYVVPTFQERKSAAQDYVKKRFPELLKQHKQGDAKKILKGELESIYGVSENYLNDLWPKAALSEQSLAAIYYKKTGIEPKFTTNSSSIGSSAVNSTSIGAGQTYSASSAGGSRLGDAFLGGDLARISIGGEFGGARGHKGIDLPYPEGTTVRAFLPGKVTYAGWCGGFGKTIGILDKDGMVNIYGHLSNIGVKVGQEISRGEEIGKSGHTGYGVTGSKGKPLKPHLHFEVRPSMNLEASKKRGGSKDPVAYVASALGYSVDSLPDSGPMFADSSTSSGSSRAASEPKGIYNEGEGDVVASAGESGESIEQTLKNAYANNQFDQTGNVQFLSAINSIRVQLGKYQQIGMVI